MTRLGERAVGMRLTVVACPACKQNVAVEPTRINALTEAAPTAGPLDGVIAVALDRARRSCPGHETILIDGEDFDEDVAALCMEFSDVLAEPVRYLPAHPWEWTPEQVAGFEKAWDEVKHQPPRLIPPKPLLTPELARELIRECVTVVKPGETLVIRVHDWWTPEQVHEYQQYLDYAAGGRFQVLAVLGDELGITEAVKPPCDCDTDKGEACSGCPA